MNLQVKGIKEELASRIAACKAIAYGGLGNEPLKVRMRARITTLQSVLSWITGQEQLGVYDLSKCQCGSVPCTNVEHNNERKVS